MKKFFLSPLIIMAVLLKVNSVVCQDLKLCYIDAKTHDTIKATYWKRLYKKSGELLNFRVSQKNSQVCLELKYDFGNKEIFSVSDTNSLWLKFQNGTNMILKNQEMVTSKKGMASTPEDLSGLSLQGVCVHYPVNHEQSLSLQSHIVEKFRIFSSRGFDNYLLEGASMNALSEGFREISIKPDKFKVMNEPKEKPTKEVKKAEPW